MKTPRWGRDRADVSPMTGTLGLFREEGPKNKGGSRAHPAYHRDTKRGLATCRVVVSRSRRELGLSHILGGSPHFTIQPEELQKKDSTLSAILPGVTDWNG